MNSGTVSTNERDEARTLPAPSATYKMWQKVIEYPLGTRLFSIAMSLKAPYFSSVLPHVVEMKPGLCVVKAPKWWGVNNHIGTFHAIAACNVAEVAMGMLAEATVPRSHRWIPKAMNVKYLKKASGSLTGTAKLPELPDFDAITRESGGQEVIVPVSLIDAKGVEAVHAEITIWVTAA